MSGLGLLATAFGSYASTLGGLYKKQVEKEQAAQEKLAAEERAFERQLALKNIDHEWERQKTAEERMFTIDMLQRKFEQGVALANYEHKLKLEEKERDFEYDQRRAVGLGGGKGDGGNIDPRIFTARVKALVERARMLGEMASNAREEERETLRNQHIAAIQDVVYFLKYGEIPEGSGDAVGTPFRDPKDIVNSLANK